MKKLIVTINKFVQVGEDEFKDVPISKAFRYDSTIEEVDDWVISQKVKEGFLAAKLSTLQE